jgi:hypothetical protein
LRKGEGIFKHTSDAELHKLNWRLALVLCTNAGNGCKRSRSMARRRRVEGQGDAGTSGKRSNKAASAKQATESLAGGLTYQVDACSYPRVLARTRLKELAPGRVLFAMGTNPLWA